MIDSRISAFENSTFSSVYYCAKNLDGNIAALLNTKIPLFTIIDSTHALFEYLKQQSIDLLLLDITENKEQILEMASKIRQDIPHLPMIIIDDQADIDILQKIIEIEWIKYFIKPLDYSKLSFVIDEVIENIRKRKEDQEIWKTLQEYKNAFDASTIISKTDKQGIITYANDEFCKISGYTREELVGLSHNVVRHPDTPIEVFQDMWKTIMAKKIWKGRIKNINKNGSYYIVDATIVPILDSSNEITEFLAIRYDITRLLELEEMERQEVQRSRDHAHEIEMAGKVNAAKESFLIIFTHELKTPLNAIINFADYLRKQILKTNLDNSSKLGDLAAQIRDNGYDMLTTVSTLLDLAKLKSNHFKFRPTLFNLQSLIESQIERSRSLTDQNGISITILGPPEAVNIKNDEEKIRQIFSNLFSNAIKYGKNKIVISYGQNGNDFWFAVDDNGPGVEDKESIFELFNQGETDDLTRTAKGTGIGLYFVKLVCDQLGLQVIVKHSDTLGGSSFIIRGTLLFNPKGNT